jgi:Domain of unknown function (DUF2019)
MKRERLEAMTVPQLVDHFAALTVAQGDALLNLEVARFNRLYDQMRAVEEELKARPGDQRSALLSLYSHGTAQVRLQAARATLGVAPNAARKLIETIANSREYPQAGDAGMTLVNLDRGIFKPS